MPSKSQLERHLNQRNLLAKGAATLKNKTKTKPDLEPSPSFCVLPWTHHHMGVEGGYSACTMSHYEDRPPLDEAGNRIDVFTPGGIGKAWNSSSMKEMRQQMLKGARPDICKRCFSLEDLGMKSYRQFMNDDRKSLIPFLLESANPDGTAPPDFRFVDIHFGNLCNLRCRMCGPAATRQLVDEYQELYPDGAERFEKYRRPGWFESTSYWDELLEYFGQVDRLHFAGGEPMINSHGWKFLRRLVDKGVSKKILLSYNTNMTVIPKQAREIWPEFQGVCLCASIDGYDSVNSYIRYPSDWETICDNLRMLDRDHREFNLCNLQIHTVAQVYNILKMTDLYDFVRTFKFMDRYLRADFVVEPRCFDIQILPRELKDLAKRRLTDYLDALSKETPVHHATAAFVAQVQGIIQHMESADASHMIPEFKRCTAVFDQNRGQRLADFVPELASL